MWNIQDRSVYQVAFSPDGRRLAFAAGDGPWEASEQSHHPGEVLAWNLSTGKHVLTLTGFDQAVTGLAFDPTGPRLATAEEALSSIGPRQQPSCLTVWDSTSGNHLWSERGHNGLLTAVA